MPDDRLWTPEGADLWVDPRSDEPEPTHAPISTALVDPSARADGSASTPDADHGARRGPRRRRPVVVGAALTVAATAASAIAVGALGRSSVAGSVDTALGQRPAIAEFAGADPRRLPESVAEAAWTLDVPLAADLGSSMIVSDDLLVVTLPSPEPCLEPRGRCADLPDRRLERPRTEVSAIDVESGRRAWTTHLPLETNDVELLGVLSGVVLAELRDTDEGSVIGIDASDGVERWRIRSGGGSVRVLHGTSVVTRSTFGSRPAQEFLDPATGASLGRITGSFVATDHTGGWWVRDRGEFGDSLTLVDLGDPFDPAVPIEEVGLSGVGRSDVDVVSVAGGYPIASLGDGRIAVHDTETGWAEVEVRARTHVGDDGGPSDADAESPPRVRLPGWIVGFTPTSGDDFALTGGGSVYGATLVDDADGLAIDVRWQLRGAITQIVPSERGMLLVVANDGGAALRVVDGASGEVLTDVQMFVGVFDSLRLVGNGFVTKRTAEVGVELAGVGLDGDDRWTLVGSDPFAVGDGTIVTRTTTDAAVRFTAYRDAGN